MTAQNDHQDRNPPNPQSENSHPAQWRELMAGHVLGDLSPEEMAEVQQYLANNPEAQHEVTELQATLNLLPLSLPENAAPPVALNAKLLESAIATPQQKQRTEAAPVASFKPRAQRQSPITWGAIAASLAAALLGFQNLQLRNNLQLAQQNLRFAQQQSERLAEVETQLASSKTDVAEYQKVISMLRLPENRLLALNGASGFSEASSGSVVIAPQRNWAMLTLKDLPKPPTGKAYQLWAIANGKKVYCVEFKPDATGKVLVEIPVGNWATTPMVSITLEYEGTIPTETSEMVMNGTVI